MSKICKRFFAALALLVCCLASTTARADTTVTINAMDAGWYTQSGLHFQNIKNFLVGHLGQSEFHNFFVFDLSTLPPGTITNATLRVVQKEIGYDSADESEIYTLFDVSTPIVDLRATHSDDSPPLRPDIYTDLGSGFIFGLMKVDRPPLYSGSITVEALLNANALNALNSTRSLFATGGAVTSLNARGSDYNEYILGATDAADVPSTQLILTIASPVLISEFRLRGPAGPTDEFVEILNRTNFPLSVSTADNSAGWALVGADGLTRFIIPNGTVIPARGHYLGTNTGYSLSSYAAGTSTTAVGDDDTTASPWTMEIADNTGIALFNTANAANFNTSNLLDAVGFGTTAAPYAEGTPLPAIGTMDGEYSLVRKVTTEAGAFLTGLPQDTNNNANDFVLVSTTGGSFGGSVPSILGAPGPENLSGPTQRNKDIRATLVDPLQPASASANRRRYRCTDTDAPAPCNANTSPQGYLSIRRTYTNNTGQPVTRLRFRVVDISTTPEGTGPGGNNIADLRALSRTPSNSPPVSFTVTRVDRSQVTVQGLALEPITVQGLTLEQPPSQPNGGGLNSSLSAPTVALQTPLAVADDPNTSEKENAINVEFLLGIVQTGNFRFLVNVEALTQSPQPTQTATATKSRSPALRGARTSARDQR